MYTYTYNISTIVTICEDGTSAKHDVSLTHSTFYGLMTQALDIVRQDIEHGYTDYFNGTRKLNPIELSNSDLGLLSDGSGIYVRDLSMDEYRLWADDSVEEEESLRWEETTDYCKLYIWYAEDIQTLVVEYRPQC